MTHYSRPTVTETVTGPKTHLTSIPTRGIPFYMGGRGSLPPLMYYIWRDSIVETMAYMRFFSCDRSCDSSRQIFTDDDEKYRGITWENRELWENREQGNRRGFNKINGLEIRNREKWSGKSGFIEKDENTDRHPFQTQAPENPCFSAICGTCQNISKIRVLTPQKAGNRHLERDDRSRLQYVQHDKYKADLAHLSHSPDHLASVTLWAIKTSGIPLTRAQVYSHPAVPVRRVDPALPSLAPWSSLEVRPGSAPGAGVPPGRPGGGGPLFCCEIINTGTPSSVDELFLEVTHELARRPDRHLGSG